MEERECFMLRVLKVFVSSFPAPLWTVIYFPDGLHLELLDVAISKDTVEAGLGTGHTSSSDLLLYSSNIMPQDSEYSRFFQTTGLEKIIQ